jgi:hypothetical protein
MSLLAAKAKEIHAKHALFVFDSCFSGTIFESKGSPVPNSIRKAARKRTRYVITAGSAGEVVPAKSTFTELLIGALDLIVKDGLVAEFSQADGNQDGFVTGRELFNYLNHAVQEKVPNQTPQDGWLPTGKKEEFGDIVFLMGKKGEPLPNPAAITLPPEESRADVGDDAFPSVVHTSLSSRLSTGQWLLAGGTMVLAGVTGVLAYKADQSNQRLNEICGGKGGLCLHPEGQTYQSSRNKQRGWGIASGLGAIVGAIGFGAWTFAF